MPRHATLAQADIARVLRAVKACGFDCLIEIDGGKITVKPFEKEKSVDVRPKVRM